MGQQQGVGMTTAVLNGHYRQLVDNAPDAIVVVSNGRLLFANTAAAELVGLPDAASLLDRNVLEFTPPDARDQIADLIRRLHAESSGFSRVETKVLRVDGAMRDVELHTCPTTYKGHKASVVFVRDTTDRKRVERELRASEERYRRLVESMNEALVVYSADATIHFVNRQFCAMFDCEPDQVVGRAAADVYAPETVRLVEAGIERRRRGLHDRYEAHLTARTGKTVFAEISAAPLINDGEFAGSLALINDITDRQRTHQKLRESERRYQELVDSAPNFIASFDLNDRYTAGNKAVCDILGRREEEVLGHTLEEVGLPAGVAREWLAQQALTRETGRTQTLETVVSFGGASPRVLRRTTNPMYGEDGSLIGVSALSIDITDQRSSEERNQKLSRAIEEMDEVMFTTTADGVITYVNPAFERIYGYTRDEAVGSTPRIIKSGHMPAGAYRNLWMELTAGRTVRQEFLNRRKDGHLVRVVASVSPIHGDDGRLTGFTAVQRDVTEERRAEDDRRKLEQHLAQAAKMQSLGTLAGGIAHDFNNILSIVITHAAVAEMSRANPVRLADALATIKAAVQRGAGLSRQILTFARKTQVQSADIDVNRAVLEISSMVREMFPRNIEIETDLDSATPSIRADTSQLNQALLNLCLNARDAMGGGGTLRLTTRLVSRNAADHVCITVSDTGHGMPPETLSRIFEPFFTTKEVGAGNGLGLAVVYGTMKAHDGWIDVSSEVGSGSSFRLYFPAAPQECLETPQSVEDERGTESVLIVEDESGIADGLSSQLADRGYAVAVANDAEEARTKLRQGAFDVIVTDLGIPRTSSRDLIKLLRAEAPGVPLIPMTGYIDPDLHQDVLDAGTQAVLQKPFTIGELVRQIREAVSTRR
jgi:PAS domain S-box-containing protein